MAGKPNWTRRGILLVISAPSGTGKSTLIRKLRREFPRLAFSVSYTTRTPRPGELDGQDYHFVDDDTFANLRKAGELAEWAEVHGHCYGTSRPAVQKMLDQGLDVLFDIDVQGSRQLRQSFSEGALIFLFPPSLQILEQRLQARGTENEESMSKRMVNARHELDQADFFDYWIVNNDLEQAYQDLRAVYMAEHLRRPHQSGLKEQVLGDWNASGT